MYINIIVIGPYILILNLLPKVIFRAEFDRDCCQNVIHQLASLILHGRDEMSIGC